jgi:Aldehyde dehydrogenase family
VTARPAGLPTMLEHFIGGTHLASVDGDTFEVADPVSNRPYARVAARAAENFRFFADMVVTLHEDAFTGSGQFGYVIRKPAGVAGLITPWNTPFIEVAAWRPRPSGREGNAASPPRKCRRYPIVCSHVAVGADGFTR